MIEKFIEEFADRAYQFAFRLCGSAEEAKELVQEAFYRVIRKWDQYDESQPLESWFLAILRNVYYDGLRRHDRKMALPLDAQVETTAEGEILSFSDVVARDGEESVLDRMVREENAAEVRAALAALSAEHRGVILLSDLEGLGYGEIAAVLDCPEGTVRSRLCRARAALRRELVKRGSEVAK